MLTEDCIEKLDDLYLLIHKARKKKHLTANDCAKKMNCTRQNWQRIESKNANITLKNLEKIIKILDLKITISL